MIPLDRIIREKIAASGPITVADYMEIALGHPDHGYYMHRDPLGARGDFITAPEISQVFGELIGLWAAVTWQQMGAPARVLLVECGPGRGTLMTDALRAAKAVPEFAGAIELHLVETSPALRDLQREALAGHAPSWHGSLDTLPDGPMIMIANEFFDALPIRQFEMTSDGWAERRIGCTADGFAFEIAAAGTAEDLPGNAAPGDIFERSPAAAEIARRIGQRIAAQGGAALVVDYGHRTPGFGDTLQAVRGHRFADPLESPGAADLTSHVDFAALADGFRDGGAETHGPLTQGAFLIALGIAARTEALARNLPGDRAAELRSATNRLIDSQQMGRLFKVSAATRRGTPAPAGFEK